MSVTVTGFGGTAPDPVLKLLAQLVATGEYTSIKAIRSQSIEYELLKAPYRTFFGVNGGGTDNKVTVYNLPSSLAEYLAALDEVHAIRSACLKNEVVITYDSTTGAFLVDPSSSLTNEFSVSSAQATLSAIAKLDNEAAANVIKSGDTVLLVGSGGREHALAVALANSPLVGKVICAPGNGGTSSSAGACGHKITNVPSDSKNETIVKLVKEHQVDMVVVGPEQPLVDGLVDVLKVECGGVRCFGPSKDAAELEASKVSFY